MGLSSNPDLNFNSTYLAIKTLAPSTFHNYKRSLKNDCYIREYLYLDDPSDLEKSDPFDLYISSRCLDPT